MFHKDNKDTKVLAKAFSLSILNQGLSSGSNFLLGLYLVRVLTPVDFGLYGIGFAVCMFFVGAGNAMFLTQMVVHLPDKAAEDKERYVVRMLLILTFFCFLCSLIVSVAIYICSLISTYANNYTGFCYAVTAASVTYLLKDFFIRHAYNLKVEIKALWINSVLSISILLMLLFLFWTKKTLSAESALYVYASGHLIAVIFGYLQSGLELEKVCLGELRSDIVEAWRHGKWALSQNLVYWVRTQAHTYVCLFFAGIHAIALVNAARILISPVIFILPALSQIMLPHLASIRQHRRRVLQQTQLAAIVLFVIAVIYSIIICLNLNAVVHLGLGKNYANNREIPTLVLAWCGIMAVQVVQTCFGSLSQALKLFKDWTYANLLGALIATTLAAILCSSLGATGAVLGTLAGEVVLLILMVRQNVKLLGKVEG